METHKMADKHIDMSALHRNEETKEKEEMINEEEGAKSVNEIIV